MRSLWAVEAQDALLLDSGGDTVEAHWTWQRLRQVHLITQLAFAAGFGFIPRLKVVMVAIVSIRAGSGSPTVLVLVTVLHAKQGQGLRRHFLQIQAVAG